jgi:hypothetical protein
MRDFIRERQNQVSRELTSESDELVDKIRPVLAHRSPMLQGAVIAELMAIWLGGHRHECREEMFKILVDVAREMIPLHEGWKR